MQIIGLGHYKRTGKDTLAKEIVRSCARINPKLVVETDSFAYKLKEICHELYGWAGLREPEYYETPEGAALREVVLPAIEKSPRQIWIDFGTKAVRDRVYRHTWRDYTLNVERACQALIITDVRFPDEVWAIRDRGGILVKVVRPGFGPGPDEADQALVGFDGWDYVVGGLPVDNSREGLSFWGKDFAKWLCNKPVQSEANREDNLAVEVINQQSE